MKKSCLIIPLVLIVCFMVGCQDNEAMAKLEEFKAQAAAEEKNIELLKSWIIDVWNQRNLSLIDTICSPECNIHYRGGHYVTNPEKMKSMVSLWHKAYSDYTNEIEDIFATGDKVVARFTLRGTQDGPWHDLPPSGRKIEVTEILIVRIEEGKIVELWPEEDVLTRWQQLGYTFKPPYEKN